MTIRILHLEDDHLDSELVEATLAADGLDVNSRVVATRDEYTTALRQPDFDLILADFSLPAFDGLAALALAQAARPDLPFIFVTGVMGEEQAIEPLKRGAVDYVYKNRLSRLAPAVRRALREANERRERLQAQAAAQAEREWLRVTLGSIGDAVIAADTAGRVTFLNAVAERLTGWSQAEAAGRPVESVFCLVDEATRRPIEGPVERVLREGTIVQLANHTLLLARDGHTCPIDDSGAPIRDEHGTLLGVVVVFRDVTQRRQAEAARNEAEARFRILANTAPVMVWMAGPDGRSDFFNNAWLAFTGHSFEQEAGEGWWDGVHPDDYARCLDTYRTAYAERRPFEMELRLRRTDGEFRWIVDMGVPRFAADGSFAGYVGSCIDIHERKAAASALAARAQQQAAVAELGQRALAGLSLPELMQAVADKVAGTLDVEYTKILQLLPDGSALRLVAGHGWREGLVGAAGEDSESPAGYSLHSGLPVIVHDLRTETRFNAPPMLSEHGVVSGLSTVIRGQPRPYGVLGAYTRQRRDFTPDDASFLQSMANVLADAIARHAAEQALRQLTVQLDRALAEAELLNTLAGDTSGEADLGRILAIALDHLRRVMAFTGGSIALVEGDALIIRAAAGPFAEQALGQRLPRGKGPSWHVVETGRQFVSNNLEESQYAPTTPIRSFLAVPLIWRGQTFGLLEVDSTQAGAFSPGDEYLLQRAATVLSGSIQLAQLHTDLERRVLARTAELQAANQQLQQSQRLLSQAQQMAHLGSWHWDIAGNTVAWSDELYHMYGLDRESFPATYEGFLERVHPDDRPLVSATIRRAIEDLF
jgi:PAS domain S-box-containing protein